MLHSGLSKSQPLPLLAGASSPRRALLAGLLRAGYFSKSATSSPVLRPTTTTGSRAGPRAAAAAGDPSRFALRPRVSFSTAPDGNSDSVGRERPLPWLAAANVGSSGGAPTARTSAGRSSSWETSADKFFSKGDQGARVETLEDSVPYKERGIGLEENEPIDNPKWGKIKDKFRRGVSRDGGSRGRGERFSGERDEGSFGRGERFSEERDGGSRGRGERFSGERDGGYRGRGERFSGERDGGFRGRGERFSGERGGGSRGRSERFSGERFDKPDMRRWNKQEDWGRKTWKEAGESTVPTMVGEGVYGVGPVLAALTAGRREFYALYTQEGMDLSRSNKKKKDKKAIEKVLLMAETMGLKVVEASKHDLNMVVDNRPHQGLVLDASPLEMVNTKELDRVRVDGGKAPVWIALDEVMDPQNLGAIIRSAYFFGAEGVVLCAKNSAPLSGVVSKASAGSLELIELLSCRNMMQFLSSSAENGWRVLGGTVAPKAIPLSEVTTGEPTILVLGSEGTGLRPLVERSCTHLVKIAGNGAGFVVGEGSDGNGDGFAAGEETDGNGDGFVVGEEIDATDADIGEEGDNYSGNQDMKSFLAVESLNVSVAAGVLLYHLAGKNVPPVSEKPSTSLV
ncbi:hypothetical protein QYE76_055325 [Lolium multiflorum]|uniref:rRNA methyltransferase 1, mitochondrial n=1 Tax=Lolium multiflorum TaxID=4521 RepID=A0AAD8WM76_LOLMU|nr:hypothetical protein QYE76_055325 [Lolium multiflorum]